MDSMPEIDRSFEQSKLLVTAIEEKAKWMPNDTYMRYPRKDWETVGYRTISCMQYARAIDKVAYWLDELLGKTTQSDTIAYSGPNDPRYAIMMPAAIKTGRKVGFEYPYTNTDNTLIICYKILIPDGRNTSEGLQALVASTDCKAWVHAADDAEGPPISKDSQLQQLALPSLDWVLSSEAQDQYPYDKTFQEAAHDVILIIHTSGTTGVPKPIYHTNGMWSAMGSLNVLSQRYWPRGIAHDGWLGKIALDCCAPQWLAGLMNMIGCPAFMDSPCVALPPDAVGLTPELFKKIMKMNRIDGIKCPPQTIVTLYEDPEARALLKTLKFVMYLGAALDRAIGDDLCQYTRLTPLIGSTETGDQFSVRPADRKLWHTHGFVPENGSKMIRLDAADGGADDFHELILERRNNADDMFQPAFWNPAFKGIDRIETKELYTPIADSDGGTRWVFSARKDDLTKLSWLAKFHAQDIEARIQQHPNVKSVCVGGEGRPAPYVIVEPKEGILDRISETQLLDDLYASVIAKTNDVDIQEIQIPRETLLTAKREKPFRRNLKQVVQRKGVEEDYQDEIEQAYLQLSKKEASAMASK
jgi:acyl-coenzyme A synthetase/AMP-(fatty) acid ligase